MTLAGGSMTLKRLDHYNLETARPDETIAFYCDVLGCVNAPERRPDFGLPGAWLLVDDHPAIHINFVDEEPAASTGAIDHVAFEGEGFLEMCAQLDSLGVDYETMELAPVDLLQIFVVDPNGIRVEINIRGENDAVAAALSSDQSRSLSGF
jgi:catechol 2,3-dioxygenase-like lactoylglutathione lyase family enzyme